jgi:hypothetical protein
MSLSSRTNDIKRAASLPLMQCSYSETVNMPYFKGTKMFDAKLVGFSMGKPFVCQFRIVRQKPNLAKFQTNQLQHNEVGD